MLFYGQQAIYRETGQEVTVLGRDSVKWEYEISDGHGNRSWVSGAKLEDVRRPSVADLHRAANRIGYTIERIHIGCTEGFQVHRNGREFGTPTYKIETASEELCTIGRMALAEKLTDGQ